MKLKWQLTFSGEDIDSMKEVASRLQGIRGVTFDSCGGQPSPTLDEPELPFDSAIEPDIPVFLTADGNRIIVSAMTDTPEPDNMEIVELLPDGGRFTHAAVISAENVEKALAELAEEHGWVPFDAGTACETVTDMKDILKEVGEEMAKTEGVTTSTDCEGKTRIDFDADWINKNRKKGKGGKES